MTGARIDARERVHMRLKLEGADGVLDHIKALTMRVFQYVPILGLTPQSVGVLGGYKVQGKNADAARKLDRRCKKM